MNPCSCLDKGGKTLYLCYIVSPTTDLYLLCELPKVTSQIISLRKVSPPVLTLWVVSDHFMGP